MATKIQWAEETWNPIVGCSVLSPGCTNCYAMKMAWRLANNPKTPHYAGTVELVKGKPVWTGKVARAPDRVLTEPLRRRKPTTYFVNSMGDLFHEDVPDAWIDQVFAVMALAPQHTFQVLTKRAGRMQAYCQSRNGMGNARLCRAINKIPAGMGNRKGALSMPLPNVWLGVSAERQAEADDRIPALLDTPAAVRFVSIEPMLGPVIVPPSLDWIICGGESGPGARPMHPDWARSLRDQCQATGTAFFFKQWGEWVPSTEIGFHGHESKPHHTMVPYEMIRVGKRAGHRTLDGFTWDEMPEAKDTAHG